AGYTVESTGPGPKAHSDRHGAGWRRRYRQGVAGILAFDDQRLPDVERSEILSVLHVHGQWPPSRDSLPETAERAQGRSGQRTYARRLLAAAQGDHGLGPTGASRYRKHSDPGSDR